MAIRRTRTRPQADTPTEPVNRVASSLARRKQQEQREARKATHVILRCTSTDTTTKAIEAAGAELQGTRPGNHLHVSDLLSKCIRRRAIHHSYGTVQPARRLSLSDMLTFAQGDAIHDLLKERCRRGRPEEVWGKWSCKCETLFHDEPCTYAEIDQNETCPHCRTKVDRYHEVSMFDEEFGIVGNPDLLFYLQRLEAFYVTEFKSIAPDQFKELVRPKPEHVLQVVFYWSIMSRLGYPMADKVSIFYANKGWMFGGSKPYKEYVIDPQAELHRLEDMYADAAAHKRFHETGELPPRVFCASANCKDAKTCEVAAPCFEL